MSWESLERVLRGDLAIQGFGCRVEGLGSRMWGVGGGLRGGVVGVTCACIKMRRSH